MAVHVGHPTRTPQAPVLTWLVAPALVALGVLLALAAVVTVVMGMAPFALASLVGLVAAVGGFWTMLDRRQR
ncbi:hypothetical protein ACF3NS_14670 [Arsenicicoccus cauae]|uniref:Uncharacterized protein n=1 Tax=Arsenicicoccus cauae TaxID=2663847 RepID=A0A6I3IHY7_9MICO|nr:hypothetical protein [Arsenicicoccus cauae]MTB71255.1 hypothetical protein [Arsenicicoccus cauae]